MISTKEISFSNEEARLIFGVQDNNIPYIEHILDVNLYSRGNLLKIRGEEEQVERTLLFFEELKRYVRGTKVLSKVEILRLSNNFQSVKEKIEVDENTISIDSKKTVIQPSNTKQKEYISAIRKYDLTVGIGPAGTGKHILL